ncbi:hypothetical protein K449DRAFT_156651 [Hypoxylon sp. EC38]|nr:hypothetical protein K449DRAFT_156651 [Hypoxylon sp. EC38]
MSGLLFGRSPRASRFACRILTFERYINTEHVSRSKPVARPNHTHNNRSGEYNEHVSVGEIQPGQHVHSVCREHYIFFPNSLRPLKEVKLKVNPCSLTIVASQRHCIDMNSMKYLDKFEHPFAKSVLKMYVEKKKEPLWYTVSSHTVALPFPCKEGARRVRHAFRDALAAYGYDREGRRVATDNSSTIADLYGTVRISTANPKAACNIKFADLLSQAKQIVSGVELALARDKNGRYINATSRPQSGSGSGSTSKTHYQKRTGAQYGAKRKLL